jgi:hypothetical protein
MNTEQQKNDERFTLVELANGGFAVYDEETPGKMDEVCIFWQGVHPYANEAAAAERARLNAWNRDSGTIRPVEHLPKPRRVPTVFGTFGTFSEPPPPSLTVDEKRRYLAEIFRSPNFTDADKFKALQEDNKMLAMLSLGNGKEQSHD